MGSLRTAAILLLVAWVASVACSAEGERSSGDDASVADTSATASGAGAQGGAGSGGEGGAGAGHPIDPCEAYPDRESCCADPSCGWHHNTGHSLWYDVEPCVDRDRVCEVAGEKVRDCPEGMICHVDGGWETEDDCAALPPRDMINLLGRGICLWPE
jgi:hypothetical protein